MRINQHVKILQQNFDCVQDSFIYFLHEKDIFNEQAFWAYYNALIGLIETNPRSRTVNRKIARMISFNHHYVLKRLVWDQNIISDKLKQYCIMERLETAADGYFAGYVIAENNYSAEFKNPTAQRHSE